ncbi:MAG: carbohydrate-binding domain-containing protein [Fibrobacter sp.]|nr:carbohydrate-binding domain-containing protein [Fibrobacter sp.]
MKSQKLPFVICSAAFLFSACGDSSSTSAENESTVNTENTEQVSGTITETPDVVSETTAIQCSDGTIVQDAAECPQGTTAAEITTYTCGDGSTVTDASSCPTIYTCADGTQTYDRNECTTATSTDKPTSGDSETPSSSSSLNSEAPTSSAESEPQIVEPEAPEPVDVTEIEGDPIIKFASGTVSIENDNGCIKQEDKTLSITCGGNYQLTGASSDNQVQVQTPTGDTANVYLYLNNLQLTSASDAPIYVRNAEKTFLMLVDGTSNTLEDASTRTKTYTKADGTLDTTGATVYAKDDLTIKGNGTLKVTGNYNNGIHSSNDLRFRDLPNVTVKAKNNAIKGKGSVTINGGKYTLNATQGDGIKSDEAEINGKDTLIIENKGIIVINGGEFDITAGDDGMQAFNYLLIADSSSTPKITVNSTGKGIVSDNRLYVNAGIVNVTSKDDGIHSNLNIYFNGGETTVSAGDDGIHADSTLLIASGSINITKAAEGMEAFYIKAQGGKTATVASDDAWNAAGGSADAGTSSGSQWGGPGGGGMASSSKGYIVITGGYHYLYAAGNDVDVLDANGTATMSGGVVILEIGSSGGMGNGRSGMGGNSGSGCSTNMAGGMIDTDNGFTISGGVLLGFGNQTEEYPSCSATSFTAGTAYGTSNAAFKPSGSGSMIIYGGDVKSVAQVDVGSMKEVKLPNGMSYYEK